MTRPAAVAMARAPRPGEAKTRLEPLLGPEGCARLQAELIRSSAAWAAAVAPGAAYVAFTPAGARSEVEALLPPSVEPFPQAEGGLGRRLGAAIETALARAGGPVLCVGSDLPVLGQGHARAAFAALRGGHDLVLGPAADGGYWLIGVARPLPEVLDLPPAAWGGPEVLELSLAAAERAGLSVALLETERDLDTPEDARALAGDPRLPAEVAALLQEAAGS